MTKEDKMNQLGDVDYLKELCEELTSSGHYTILGVDHVTLTVDFANLVAPRLYLIADRLKYLIDYLRELAEALYGDKCHTNAISMALTEVVVARLHQVTDRLGYLEGDKKC